MVRNLNLLPSDYSFLPRRRCRLSLRRLTLRKETLGFRRAGFSPALSLLMSAFALPIPPADFSIHLHRLTERSSTAHTEVCTPSFGLPLSPVKSSAQTRSEERRVGKDCVSTCRSRWSPYHSQKTAHT